MKIYVEQIVGKNAISMQSGKILYEKVSEPLILNEMLELDFSGVELFASPFFNASIGLLLRDIELADLQQRLNIININLVGKQLLNHVIKNAINYYSMEAKSKEAMKTIISDSDEK